MLQSESDGSEEGPWSQPNVSRRQVETDCGSAELWRDIRHRRVGLTLTRAEYEDVTQGL